MRIGLSYGLSLALGVLCTGGLAWPAIADEIPLPQRKPGQWRLTSISAELGMTTFETCIRPGDSIAAPVRRTDVSTANVERFDDQVIVNVICASKAGEESISTLFTGDFTTWYRPSPDHLRPALPGGATVGVTVDARIPRVGLLGSEGAGNPRTGKISRKTEKNLNSSGKTSRRRQSVAWSRE